MSYKTGFKNGRLGIGIPSGGGDGNGDPLYPLDINGDIRLTGAIVKADGTIYSSGGGVGVKGLYSVQDSNTGKYKFGVGKSNPIYTLDVSGSLNLDGDIYVNGVSLSSGESTTASQALQTGDDPSWVSNVVTEIGFDELVPLPDSLDTLKEIALVVKDISESTVAGLTTTIDSKANKASPEFTGTVTAQNLNITGNFQMNGQTPTFSNWEVSGDDIFRNSKVTIGQNSVSTTDMTLFVNGDTHINGTLSAYNIVSATTLSGSLPYTSLTGTPTTITATQASNITTNNAKVSSQWITGSSSKIYYNSGNVGIGTTSPGEKLSVNGSIQIKGSSNSTVTNESKLIFTRDLADSDESEYIAQIYTANSSGPLILESGRGGGYVKAKGNSTTTYPLFTVNNHDDTEKFRINGHGNVGIGTTSPYTKLDFGDTGGDIRLSKISVSSGLTNRYIGKYQDGATNPWYCAIKFGGTTVSAEFPWDDDYVEDYISFILYNSKPYVSSPGPNEIMKITGAGNVGIGTTTPVSSLHINCLNDYNDGLYIQAGAYNGADSNGGNFLFQQNQHSSTTSKAFRLEEWSSSHSHKRTVMCWQRYTGNVGIGYHIPSYKLHVNGSAYFSSGGLNGSDDRIKHNEKPITNALSIILKLKPKHYIKTGTKLYDASHNFQLDASGNPLDASGNPLEYIKDYTIETGIIAQEIRNISELKFTVYGKDYEDEEDHPLGVDYNSIHCTHIAATQELDRKVIELEAENEELKTEVATLKSELAAIKAHLGI